MQEEIRGARVTKVVALDVRLRLAEYELAPLGLLEVARRYLIFLVSLDGKPARSYDFIS